MMDDAMLDMREWERGQATGTIIVAGPSVGHP